MFLLSDTKHILDYICNNLPTSPRDFLSIVTMIDLSFKVAALCIFVTCQDCFQKNLKVLRLIYVKHDLRLYYYCVRYSNSIDANYLF